MYIFRINNSLKIYFKIKYVYIQNNKKKFLINFLIYIKLNIFFYNIIISNKKISFFLINIIELKLSVIFNYNLKKIFVIKIYENNHYL